MVVHTYDKNMFCLMHLQTSSNASSEEDLQLSFRFCTKERRHIDGEEFTLMFYPTAMLVSSVFLLLTLVVYLLDPDLHRPLFGKITIGFVFNNLIAYLCLFGNYFNMFLDASLFPYGTFGCVIIGYLTLYTFTSFMFWINAMAANIFFKFSSMMSSSSDHHNDNTKLFLYMLYSQVWFQ